MNIKETLRNAATGAIWAAIIFSLQARLVSCGINLPHKDKDFHYLCDDTDNAEEKEPIFPLEKYHQLNDDRYKTGVWTFTSPDDLLEVKMVGMNHVASPSFYKEVAHVFEQTDHVIKEGVTGMDRLFLHPESPFAAYARMVFGNRIREANNSDIVTSQETFYSPYGSGTELPGEIVDATFEDLIAETDTPLQNWHWFNTAVRTYAGITILEIANQPYFVPKEKKGVQKRIKYIMGKDPTYQLHLLICTRNPLPLQKLDELHEEARATSKKKTVGLPWGVLHLPDFVRHLTEKGYTVTDHGYMTAISFAEE